ncbi:hypothetical protein A2U01_0104255, partial [Trifolium medium]|nr:hypothetical protein [Trifolium medium]
DGRSGQSVPKEVIQVVESSDKPDEVIPVMAPAVADKSTTPISHEKKKDVGQLSGLKQGEARSTSSKSN